MATPERLFNLLPAIHRRRDSEQGDALKALMGVMEAELDIFTEDLDTLYENWFIETCEEWAVPYVGDLLGLKGLYPGIPGIFSQRAFVANTLAFRRRKGTTMVLEQLARDATGWPSKVVEFFELMGATQNINHPRIGKGGTALIRDANRMDLVHTAFDVSAHTADIRRNQAGDSESGGTYNIPNVGIYVWPLPAYEVREAQPRVTTADLDCFHFSPLGLDLPLFNVPQTEEDISQFAGEINLPTPLRRRPLFDETERLRDPTADVAVDSLYFTPGQEVLGVEINGTPVPPAEILITDLRDWTKPDPTKTYTYFEGGSEQSENRTITVAVDPVFGRLAFPDGQAPAADAVRVNYAYGFIGDLGGGPYNRRGSVLENLPETIDWQAGVVANPTPVAGEELYATLLDAIVAWNAQPAGTIGLITVMDSRSYTDALTAANAIELKDGSSLMLVAADWPVIGAIENVSVGERKPGRIVPSGVRPHLDCDIEILGSAPGESLTPGTLILDGFIVEGDVTVLEGNLGTLRLAHVNLFDDGAGTGRLVVQANASSGAPGTYNENLSVVFERSIARQLDLSASVARLLTIDSIIHNEVGSPPVAIDAGKTRADIRSTTVLGETALRTIEGENSIFMDALRVERRQEGCVRYCSLHEDSVTPRRFRCQPDLAIQLRDSGEESPHVGFSDELTRERVRPTFASKSPGHPAYLRLRTGAPAEIRTGAEDGSEMGALFHLKQAQRETNLRTNLGEYLRFGKEVSVFFVVPRPEDI